MLVFKRLTKIVLLVSVILFICAYFQKAKLPEGHDIVRELSQEPIQTETAEAPFQIEQGGIIYTIEPLYDYELCGLVVSYHHSKSWFDYYHERWSDYINIKDICVIWGTNVENNIYKKMDFSSGNWTCYMKFKKDTTQEDWQHFSYEALSNNHLLSDNRQISKEILNAKKGDQIYLKGYLVQYSHGEGFRRGTSTTRTDMGNGSCETIYVTDFRIIKKANTFWHSLYSYTKYLIIFSVIILIVFLLIPPSYRVKRLNFYDHKF